MTDSSRKPPENLPKTPRKPPENLPETSPDEAEALAGVPAATRVAEFLSAAYPGRGWTLIVDGDDARNHVLVTFGGPLETGARLRLAADSYETALAAAFTNDPARH